MAAKIRRDDEVVVIAGKDKGTPRQSIASASR
jgi:ribosomal protein L24